MRRCHILRASARGQRPSAIARTVGCATQTVRNAIRDFHAEGVACISKQSSRPKTVQPIVDDPNCEALQARLHQSPRDFGNPTSVWTLALAAEVCQEQGVTEHRVSIETIRHALQRLQVSWRRAKHWITSPDPEYERKKSGVTG
jgi:transposase